jgi:hypothetical protein
MESVVMAATKKTQQPAPTEQASAGTATFVEDRAVAGLLVASEQLEAPAKVGGRYKVNGVWVNANGERLDDQSEDN